VRQPTILDYFVRDSALLGLDACARRNNAGIDAHTNVAGPECNRAFSAAGHFKASSRKSRRSAQRRSGAVPLRRCEGPLVARKAAHRRRRMIQGCLGWLEAFYRESPSAVIDTSIPGRAV